MVRAGPLWKRAAVLTVSLRPRHSGVSLTVHRMKGSMAFCTSASSICDMTSPSSPKLNPWEAANRGACSLVSDKSELSKSP